MSVLQIAGFCLVSVVVMSAVLAIFTVTENIKLSRNAFRDGDEL
jgi:hypothetical protein